KSCYSQSSCEIQQTTARNGLLIRVVNRECSMKQFCRLCSIKLSAAHDLQQMTLMKKEHIDGTVDDKFEAVKESFRRNFSEGWERGGAAFAVYHRGKLEVDLWGGYADKSCNRLWNEDTITTIFSCTKSVAAICMAILVDRGLCNYGDKVIQYWPEFGQNGKTDITIQMILAHKAGLPYFEPALTLADLTDGLRMATIVEQEAPKYPPGTKTAYHPLTYGWLVDQIFCRIDPEHRTVGQFFRDEIEAKHRFGIVRDCTYFFVSVYRDDLRASVSVWDECCEADEFDDDFRLRSRFRRLVYIIGFAGFWHRDLLGRVKGFSVEKMEQVARTRRRKTLQSKQNHGSEMMIMMAKQMMVMICTVIQH
ncbi:hypothetical protein Y032_0553g3352, partial [Ancylostoma ceylanicum]